MSERLLFPESIFYIEFVVVCICIHDFPSAVLGKYYLCMTRGTTGVPLPM